MKLASFKPSQRFGRIYTLSVLAASGVLAVLRTLSLALCYDDPIGYYRAGAFLPVMADVAVLLVLLAMLAVCLSAKPEVNTCPQTPLKTSLSFAVGAMLVLYVPIAYTVFGLGELLEIYRSGLLTPQVLSQLKTTLTLHVFAIAFALLSSLYFFLSYRKASNGCTWLGLFTVAYLISAVAISYFDHFFPINAPQKLWMQIAAIAAMLAAVAELKAEANGKVRRMDLFLTSAAALLCACYAIPTVIGVLFNFVVSDPYTPFSYVLLTLAAYFALRLWYLGAPLKDEQAETEQEIAPMEADRQENDTMKGE